MPGSCLTTSKNICCKSQFHTDLISFLTPFQKIMFAMVLHDIWLSLQMTSWSITIKTFALHSMLFWILIKINRNPLTQRKIESSKRRSSVTVFIYHLPVGWRIRISGQTTLYVELEANYCHNIGVKHKWTNSIFEKFKGHVWRIHERFMPLWYML